MNHPVLTIGTRTSKLALWQTHHMMEQLKTAWPGLECQIRPFITQGDKTLDKSLPEIGGKGLFTAELEHALICGEIDLAVHSLKDLPTESAPRLLIGAILGREDVHDGLLSHNRHPLAHLPPGAVVGTSSTRRQAQLLAVRPDLTIRPIRGNVETRLRKVQTGEYEATILAMAGLNRLGLADAVAERLPLELMLPAPGQGALAVQCRADDASTLSYLAPIDNQEVRTAVTAERAFLKAVGGGCAAPVAAYAVVANGRIYLRGLVANPDGSQMVRALHIGDAPETTGTQLAQELLSARSHR